MTNISIKKSVDTARAKPLKNLLCWVFMWNKKKLSKKIEMLPPFLGEWCFITHQKQTNLCKVLICVMHGPHFNALLEHSLCAFVYFLLTLPFSAEMFFFPLFLFIFIHSSSK